VHEPTDHDFDLSADDERDIPLFTGNPVVFGAPEPDTSVPDWPDARPCQPTHHHHAPRLDAPLPAPINLPAVEAVTDEPLNAPAFTEGLGDLVILRTDQGVQIVTIESPTLREPGVHQITERLVRMARDDGPRIALSLGLVKEITSASLGALVRAAEDIDRMGGRLVLFALPHGVNRVLRQTGLARKLTIAEDAETAAKLARRDKFRFSFARRAG
jgi:anti-anti-sigma factor